MWLQSGESSGGVSTLSFFALGVRPREHGSRPQSGRLQGRGEGLGARLQLQGDEQLCSGRTVGSGNLLAQRQEEEDLGLSKCLLHQEINSLRAGSRDEE